MMKGLLILFIATPLWSACPLYSYRQSPQLNQEIQNICANIANPKENNATANAITMNGPFQLAALTLAQIQGLTTAVSGQEYYCSDCVTDVVCVSTATNHKGSFARQSARTTVCQ